MKAGPLICLLSLLAFASGCASLHASRDAMCPEIAAFANATQDSARHEVVLVNDRPWRTERDESGREVIVVTESKCEHFGYKPGEGLCDYLTEHTSFEFFDANVNRVLVCLRAAEPTKMVYDIEYEQVILWSNVARGVRAGVRVGFEFRLDKEDEAPALKIFAEDKKATTK